MGFFKKINSAAAIAIVSPVPLKTRENEETFASYFEKILMQLQKIRHLP